MENGSYIHFDFNKQTGMKIEIEGISKLEAIGLLTIQLEMMIKENTEHAIKATNEHNESKQNG